MRPFVILLLSVACSTSPKQLSTPVEERPAATKPPTEKQKPVDCHLLAEHFHKLGWKERETKSVKEAVSTEDMEISRKQHAEIFLPHCESKVTFELYECLMGKESLQDTDECY